MEDYQKNKILDALILLRYMGFKDIDRKLVNTDPLIDLNKEVAKCRKCRLHQTRTNTVFGEGPKDANLVIIGEAPGGQEDKQGVPFVGAAGEELNRILTMAGVNRSEIFITNVVKCRPPGNRNPNNDEIDICNYYLRRQLEIINPQVLVILGNVALSLITGTIGGITGLRGKKMEYLSYPAIPTFHPAYVIRNPGSRKIIVEDIKKAFRLIN